MTAIAFSQVVGPVPLDVIVSEKHESELDITTQPVEFGAAITDHAYSLPKKLLLDVADGAAALTYMMLVAFQESRVPFTIVSGLYVYTNMLIKRLEADRDREFSQVLRCRAELQEVIIVSSAYVPGTGSTGLSAETAGDPVTADRVGGTVQQGDLGPATGVGGAVDDQERQTILRRIFGPSE